MNDGYPHSTPMPKKKLAWSPRLSWLREQFGLEGKRWCANLDRYWFRDESDYVIFVLRWR